MSHNASPPGPFARMFAQDTVRLLEEHPVQTPHVATEADRTLLFNLLAVVGQSCIDAERLAVKLGQSEEALVAQELARRPL